MLGSYEHLAGAAASMPRHCQFSPDGRVAAAICRDLDGIPLAIELAAARTNALGVEELAARLDDCLHPLTGSCRMAQARHQMLGQHVTRVISCRCYRRPLVGEYRKAQMDDSCDDGADVGGQNIQHGLAEIARPRSSGPARAGSKRRPSAPRPCRC
jgi:hypothetical protein